MRARGGVLSIKFETLVLFLMSLFLFDGVVRFVASILDLYVLNAWKDVLVFLMMGVAVFYVLVVSQRIYVRAYLAWFALFAAFWIFWGIAHHGLIQTLWGAKIVLLPPIFFLVIFQVWKPKIETLERFYKFLMIPFIPIVILGILQYVTQFEILKAIGGGLSYAYVKIAILMGVPRAIGTFRMPFAFGDFCFMVTMMGMGFLFRSVTPTRRWRYLAIVILGVIGVYVSTSRASMLMTLFGMFLWLILRGIPWRSIRIVVVFLVSILTPLMVLALVVFVLGRNVELPFIWTYSTFERLYFWGRALVDFPLLASPFRFFFGYGLGAIGTAQLYSNSPFVRYNPVDNVFLWALVQFGVVGSLLFFALWLYPFVRLLARLPQDWYLKRTWVLQVIGIVIALTIVFAEGMYRLFFEGFPLPYLYWFLHLTLLYNMRTRETSGEPKP